MLRVGQLYRLTYDVTDAAGALVTPSAVQLAITKPDGTLVTPAPVPSPNGTGRYTYDHACAVAGRHVATWTTTGPTTTGSDVFNVEPATDWLVSLDQVKSHLNITSTRSDVELELMIAAATAKIEERTGPILPRAMTARIDACWRRSVWLQPPILSVTSAVPLTGGTALDVAQLDVDQVYGRVAYLDGRCFPAGAYLWTWQAGRTQVPAGLQLAALNFIRGSWETQKGASGLPLQQAADDPIEVPGMGLVNWRLEQDLVPYAQLPGVA